MKAVSLVFLLCCSSLAFAQESFTAEELEEILAHRNGLQQEAQEGLGRVATENALMRDKRNSTIVCYDGTNPSSSGLGQTVQEAKADARLRRSINACLTILTYMSTNNCRKSMGLNLPPNTHPKKTIETLLANDANVYPLMKQNGSIEKCLTGEGLDLKTHMYIQLYVGHMSGSPELPKCGPIGDSYKWIKNVQGGPQLFRGDRGYVWGHVYDRGVSEICGN